MLLPLIPSVIGLTATAPLVIAVSALVLVILHQCAVALGEG